MTRGLPAAAMAAVENPYQPPHEAEVSAPALGAPRPGLYPLAGLAILSLRLYLAATVYVVVEHLYYTFIVADAAVPLEDEIGMMPSDVIGIVLQIVNGASIILFLTWKYRAAANARELDPQAMGVSPGMAVASYFIPLLNLVLPCAAMAGIARASRVERFWVAAWAVCYVGFFVLVAIAMVVSIKVEPRGVDSGESWDVFMNHFIVFWSVLTYFFSWQIMMRITRAQMTPESPLEEAIPA